MGGSVARAQTISTGESETTKYDFERLERATGQLIQSQQRLAAENEVLRKQLVECERQVLELDQRVNQQEQKRTDALKRVDDLVALVEGFTTLATQAAER